MLEKHNHPDGARAFKASRHRTVAAVGWGLFFIWIGIAVLADVGWGIGLIGIGVLILGLRAAHEYLSGSGCGGTQKARF